MDIADNWLLVMFMQPYLLDFDEKGYKKLRSNRRHGVKEIIIACCNHVSPLKFSEFG